MADALEGAVITATHRRAIIEAVSARWDNQYRAERATPDKRAKGDILRRLDRATATRETIDAVIGNGSWTANICDECGEDAELLISISGAAGYHEGDMSLCQPCIAQIADFSKAVEPRP